MSGSRTIIAEHDSRLANVHPGEILREDFLIGDAAAMRSVAEAAGIPLSHMAALLRGHAAIDAEVDLRLARHLGMSEGFFLGLQHDHDLEAARDRHRGSLDRIVRRAA